jgi:hypothetical protein
MDRHACVRQVGLQSSVTPHMQQVQERQIRPQTCLHLSKMLQCMQDQSTLRHVDQSPASTTFASSRCSSGFQTADLEQVEPTQQAGWTTVMIRNLPNEAKQSLFLYELDSSGFAGLYDFAYLPSEFNSQANKGYAFVNFVSAAVASAFVGAWHKSDHCGAQTPYLNISPATVQGHDANVKKWAGQRIHRIRNAALRPFVRQVGAVGTLPSSSGSPLVVPPAPRASTKWQGPPKSRSCLPKKFQAAAGLPSATSTTS